MRTLELYNMLYMQACHLDIYEKHNHQQKRSEASIVLSWFQAKLTFCFRIISSRIPISQFQLFTGSSREFWQFCWLHILWKCFDRTIFYILTIFVSCLKIVEMHWSLQNVCFNFSLAGASNHIPLLVLKPSLIFCKVKLQITINFSVTETTPPKFINRVMLFHVIWLCTWYCMLLFLYDVTFSRNFITYRLYSLKSYSSSNAGLIQKLGATKKSFF